MVKKDLTKNLGLKGEINVQEEIYEKIEEVEEEFFGKIEKPETCLLIKRKPSFPEKTYHCFARNWYILQETLRECSSGFITCEARETIINCLKEIYDTAILLIGFCMAKGIRVECSLIKMLNQVDKFRIELIKSPETTTYKKIQKFWSEINFPLGLKLRELIKMIRGNENGNRGRNRKSENTL